MATVTRRLAALLGASGAGLTDSATASKITTDSINDDAVNAAKIAANAVGTSEVADNVLTATDLAANSVGESELSVDYTAQSVPHIIPGVLHPAVEGKTLSGVAVNTAHGSTYTYGTTINDGTGLKYYYTDIKGSKPIKDPRIGAHFGSQRHKFKSLQILEQETATHGNNVFSVDGREWIRGVGTWQVGNNTSGNYISQPNATNNATDRIEIVGYFSGVNLIGFTGTADKAEFSVNGGSASTSDFLNASVNTPLNGRYVDAGGVVNLTNSLTLGINTLTLIPDGTAGTYYYGIELIAQDTTSTANRSKIQIPSQNVVSHGKKFNVSAEGSSGHHYNPFNGYTATSSFSSVVDVNTSLGLEAWKHSDNNYYPPVNGGRIVKWVDENNTIKTSVTLVPPNATGIGSLSSNPRDPNYGSWSSQYQPTFKNETERQLHEVAKTFHVREFGNGAANEGSNTSGSYQDASMLLNSDGWIAYVMDDGLTSCSAFDFNGNPTSSKECILRSGASDYIYYTFIGTGLSLLIEAPEGTEQILHIAQNLPYGSHVFKYESNSSNSDHMTLTLDGVSLAGAYNPSDTPLLKYVSFHQPKRPPIPEDACVIADYMLYADWVPIGDAETGYISKGARRTHGSRDVFVNRDSGSNSPVLTQQYESQSFGYRLTPGSSSPCSIDLPVFSNKFAVYSEILDNAGYAMSFGGTSSTITKLDNSQIDDLDAFVGPTTTTNLGVNKLELTVPGGYHFQGFDSAGIIHTSSHYQSFESPFLHELIGGDRNMEQTNLVVSPDGKTWDEVTRDTSYVSGGGVRCDVASSSNNHARAIFTEWRGEVDKYYDGSSTQSYSASEPFYNKNFAIAYDRLICLKDGKYNIYFQTHTDDNMNGSAWGMIVKNGKMLLRAYFHDTNYPQVPMSCAVNLERGDYIAIEAIVKSDLQVQSVLNIFQV